MEDGRVNEKLGGDDEKIKNKRALDREIGYEKAKEEFLDFYMKQSKTIHTWKLLSFISLVLLAVSLSITFYLSTRSSLIPYVIEVDSTGNAKAINTAYEVKYVPDDVAQSYFLKEVLRDMRSVPRDKVLVGRNFKKNLFFLNGFSEKKYRDLIQKEKLSEMVEMFLSRDVFINSFTKISGTKNSYQVRWEEKIYDKNGEVVSKENLIGIFTLDKKQPKTLEEIDNNPLGIMVTDFSISKEK